MKTDMKNNKNWMGRMLMTVLSLCVMTCLGAIDSRAETKTASILGLEYTYDNKTMTMEVSGVLDKSMTEAVIIEETTLQEGNFVVTGIAARCFEGCEQLKSVTISKHVAVIGDYCFKGCVSLESVTIPDGVESMGRECFADCMNLGTVEILTGKLKSMPDGCFLNCGKLSRMIVRPVTPPSCTRSDDGQWTDPFLGANVEGSLFVPKESVEAYRESDTWKAWTNVVPFDFAAFDEYESTKLVDLGNGKYVGQAIRNTYTLDHDALTATFVAPASNLDGPYNGDPREWVNDIVIPEYVLFDHKPYTVTSLGKESLYNYPWIKTVTIPSTVKELGTNCFSLSGPPTIYLPEGVVKLGDGCFSDSYLREIELPATLTSIGAYCFAECSQLTKVIIRSGNLEEIGKSCFANSYKLAELVCYANQVPTFEYDERYTPQRNPFYGTNAKEGTLYVQKHLVEAFKAADGWKEWKNILPIDVYGTVDAIESTAIAVKDAAIYDLQGRKVTTPQKNGLYIKNGKKFLYKD